MPYIAQEDRDALDPHIDALAGAIVERAEANGHDAAFAGLVNYSVTRLALKVLRTQFGAIRYWMIATLSGVFSNVALEFYRRIAASYEDKQIEKSGDVDVFEEFSKDIDKL